MALPFSTTTTITTPSRCRYKHIILAALFALCIPIYVFHLIPQYTSTVDNLVTHMLPSSSSSSNSGGGFCTKAIGNAQCCALYLAAAPCVDECRKTHVDRVTLRLTKEYEECADGCLKEYEDGCTRAKGS